MLRVFIRSTRTIDQGSKALLAWMRTAIAVMGFGFLVEKFDLFLELF
jgi:uncharacterized membrane protein YidH (DUF202 family)